MAHCIRLFLVLIVAIVYSGPVLSQQSSSPPDNAQTSDAALREKAFKLLESVAGEIGSLQSAENRARLGSNVAASLWPHDERRARTLLASVEEDIRAGLQNRESDDPMDQQTLMVFLRLREDTVERIAKHDAELALAFLKATEPTFEKPPNGFEERQRALEIQLAKGIAGTNPDLALKLGRRSLSRGLSYGLLPLLRQLGRKHKEQAQMLHKEIVGKVRSANLPHGWALMNFARDLTYSFTPPLADDSTFRDLINFFITSALANGCGAKTPPGDKVYFCRELASLVVQMEKTDPLRAAQLKHLVGEVQPPLQPAIYELNDLAQNGTADEILELATKYPQIEVQVYWAAIDKAISSGDLERARNIATNYGGHPEQRRQMLARIEGPPQISASMNDEKMAEVQRTLSTIPRIQHRLDYVFSLAIHIGPNDRKAALNLIDQASGIIDTMEPGKQQTEAQMFLAMIFCLKNSERGWAVMEFLVPKLNELVSAAAKLDRYDNRYLRDGEWNMTGEGGVGALLTSLARNAGHFAWCDFDRAVNLAAQFDRPEIRLMAHVKLAQGILAGRPSKLR